TATARLHDLGSGISSPPSKTTSSPISIGVNFPHPKTARIFRLPEKYHAGVRKYHDQHLARFHANSPERAGQKQHHEETNNVRCRLCGDSGPVDLRRACLPGKRDPAACRPHRLIAQRSARTLSFAGAALSTLIPHGRRSRSPFDVFNQRICSCSTSSISYWWAAWLPSSSSTRCYRHANFPKCHSGKSGVC